MSFEIKLNMDANKLINAFKENLSVANEAVGLKAEEFIVENTPVGTPESTGIKNYHGGSLKQSITHKVIDNTVYVGTNMRSPGGAPYPIYLEYGTGIFAEGGNGRKSPWVWKDKNGDYHYTHGIQPTHFMRNALSKPEHIEKFKEIYEDKLKNG